MSVYAYDEAIVQNFRRIFENGKIYIVPPEDMFSLMGTVKQDNIKMPMIGLRRPGWNLLDARPHRMKFEGVIADISEEKDVTLLQAIPIRINYQIDIWTESRLENDLILRELIFYLSTRPTLQVEIVYKDFVGKHNFNLLIDGEVEDNSDLVAHKDRGRYFRQTISVYTDDAYLWKTSMRGPTIIDPDNISIGIDRGDKLDLV